MIFTSISYGTITFEKKITPCESSLSYFCIYVLAVSVWEFVKLALVNENCVVVGVVWGRRCVYSC